MLTEEQRRKEKLKHDIDELRSNYSRFSQTFDRRKQTQSNTVIPRKKK